MNAERRGGGEETVVLVAAAVAVVVGAVAWAGAALAALTAGNPSAPPAVSVGEAVIGLATTPGRWMLDSAARAALASSTNHMPNRGEIWGKIHLG